MAIDPNYIFQTYVIPLLRTVLYLGIGLGSSIGVGYYLFVIKRRRKWMVNIWEKKADGALQLITKDVLIEKKINKGKQLIYRLRRQKAEAFPPPWECTYRVRGKEYCDYLRIREDYIPLTKELDSVNNLPEGKKEIIKFIKNKLKQLRGKSKEEIDKEYILLPINQSMTANIKFKPMDYDVNMMRINAIDIRDKIYMDTQNWLQKYGTFIAFGVIVILIIVVLYLSYDYSSHVIDTAMGKSSEVASMMEKIAEQMGGKVPAQ